MGEGCIVLAGGSGFLGRLLSGHLASSGYEVVVLSRSPSGNGGATTVAWDGETIGPWREYIKGARAVVNLAGRSVNCRYTRANRREILQSRLRSTRVLGEAIAHCDDPPPVWLNASTATIYKHSLDEPNDDLTGEIGATPEAKDAFSVEVAVAWERELAEAPTPATRKVALRAAMVLFPEKGGVFDVLRRLVRLRLGGTMGSGDQYVSWIVDDDFCRAVEFLIQHDDIDGPVNLAAPNPVTNRALMRTLRRLCGVRVGLPATRWMLEAGALFLRTETELVIKSRNVIPTRLLDAGFEFHYPDIESAASELLKRKT